VTTSDDDGRSLRCVASVADVDVASANVTLVVRCTHEQFVDSWPIHTARRRRRRHSSRPSKRRDELRRAVWIGYDAHAYSHTHSYKPYQLSTYGHKLTLTVTLALTLYHPGAPEQPYKGKVLPYSLPSVWPMQS